MPKNYPKIQVKTDHEQCNANSIHINCPDIPKIADKFNVTENQVRDWIESGKGSCWSYRLPVYCDSWWYRVRAEMTGGAG